MSSRFNAGACAVTLAAALASAAQPAAAAVVDRVLAVVDNQLITLSDAQRYRALFAPATAPADLVQELIDRVLLLGEARRFETAQPTVAERAAAEAELAQRLGGPEQLTAVRAELGISDAELDRLITEQWLVRRLIEQRIEFFVFVSPTEVDEVYAAEAASGRFAGVAVDAAKRQIEQRLFQAKAREKQRSYLARLRTRATIQLNPEAASSHRTRRRNAMADQNATLETEIKQEIAGHTILIYGKGTKEAPRCGFTLETIQFFEKYGYPYAVIDVLNNMPKREALSRLTNWPTLPKVFIGGEFFGDTDILDEMERKGEVKPLLEKVFKTA